MRAVNISVRLAVVLVSVKKREADSLLALSGLTGEDRRGGWGVGGTWFGTLPWRITLSSQ